MSRSYYCFSIKLCIQGSISVAGCSGMCLPKFAIAFTAWNWIIRKTLILQLAKVLGRTLLHWGKYVLSSRLNKRTVCLLRTVIAELYSPLIFWISKRTECVPSSKHSHLGYICTVMYEAKVSVCSDIRIKHINAIWAACRNCDLYTWWYVSNW